MTNIKISISGKEYEFQEEEARLLYKELEKLYNPIPPAIPFTTIKYLTPFYYPNTTPYYPYQPNPGPTCQPFFS